MCWFDPTTCQLLLRSTTKGGPGLQGYSGYLGTCWPGHIPAWPACGRSSYRGNGTRSQIFYRGRSPHRGSGGFIRRWWRRCGVSLAGRRWTSLHQRNPPPLVLLDGGDGPPRTGCLSSRLATESSVCLPTAAPDSPHTSEGVSAGPQATSGGPLLARETLVSTAVQALLQLSMAPPLQEGPPFTAGGPDLAPRSPSPPALGLAAAGPDSLLNVCTETVRNTILNARAPSTRAQYANRWKLFSDWCRGKAVDPARCSVATVLEFLQSLLDDGRSHSTLRVYVAAISSRHEMLDGATVGCHRLVSLFLRGGPEAASP